MAFCKYMKMITLPKLRDSLRDMKLRGQGPARDRRAARSCRSSAWSRSAERGGPAGSSAPRRGDLEPESDPMRAGQRRRRWWRSARCSLAVARWSRVRGRALRSPAPARAQIRSRHPADGATHRRGSTTTADVPVAGVADRRRLPFSEATTCTALLRRLPAHAHASCSPRPTASSTPTRTAVRLAHGICTGLNDPGGDGPHSLIPNDIDVILGPYDPDCFGVGSEHDAVQTSTWPVGYDPDATENDLAWIVARRLPRPSRDRDRDRDDGALGSPAPPTG